MVAFLLLCFFSFAFAFPASSSLNPMFARYRAQVQVAMSAIGDDYTVYPANTANSSSDPSFWAWEYGNEESWTSGHFPGLLWNMANFTGAAEYADLAYQLTINLQNRSFDTSTHDIGFVIFLSYGKAVELWQNYTGFQATILQAAESLSMRYSPIVGMTRSWGSIDDDTQFQVIIDNLMNLELLFWAAQVSGNTTLYDMAVSHVDKTAEYWIRGDGSTFHLVVFNPLNASVISRSGSPQGLGVNSTWARGQSWGIYGFIMAYRYTGNAAYIGFARNLTDYWLSNVPSDFIPMFDFAATPPDNYRDTSSAAIASSAWLELAKTTGDRYYLDAALNTMASLSSAPYQSAPGASMAVLSQCAHDCGSTACTIIESDFYYYEALVRLHAWFPEHASRLH